MRPVELRLPGLFWRFKGGDGVKTADLGLRRTRSWVVMAAVPVMFMQAGFAFLEGGLTRMRTRPTSRVRTSLVFGLCTLDHWAVGFGLALL